MASEIEFVYRQEKKPDGGTKSIGDPIGFVHTNREKRRSTISGYLGEPPKEQDPRKAESPLPDDQRRIRVYGPKVIRRWTPDGLISLVRQPWSQHVAYNAVLKADFQRQRTAAIKERQRPPRR